MIYQRILMTEELAAFLELAKARQSSPEDLRKIMSVLKTMEQYMTKTQWEVYLFLKSTLKSSRKLFSQLFFKLINVFEFPMHGSEADIGDFVDAFEFPHDVVYYGCACNFFFICSPLFFKFIEEFINTFLCNGSFRTGEQDAAFQFAAIEWFACTIAFDDNKRNNFLSLKGCETIFTLFTHPSSTNSTTVFKRDGTREPF